MTDETHYAFPHKFQSSPNETTVCFGMTLRDYFAAKAMQGIIAGWTTSMPPAKEMAEAAYQYANEMLKAREQ